MANRPGIIKSKIEITFFLVDVTITVDRNVAQMEAEKKLKFKMLCIETKVMWNITCNV
jgi:hypothetical protein